MPLVTVTKTRRPARRIRRVRRVRRDRLNSANLVLGLAQLEVSLAQLLLAMPKLRAKIQEQALPEQVTPGLAQSEPPQIGRGEHPGAVPEVGGALFTERLATAAKAIALLLEVLRVDRYFAEQWTDAVMSPASSEEELRDASLALEAALRRLGWL